MDAIILQQLEKFANVDNKLDWCEWSDSFIETDEVDGVYSYDIIHDDFTICLRFEIAYRREVTFHYGTPEPPTVVWYCSPRVCLDSIYICYEDGSDEMYQRCEIATHILASCQDRIISEIKNN